MKFNLGDFGKHKNFAPLSLTRPIACLRMGIHTNQERYALLLPDASFGFETEDYLSEKYPKIDADLLVNACVIPNQEFIATLIHLEENQSLYKDNLLLAKKGSGENKLIYLGNDLIIIEERWDLFKSNHNALIQDFNYLTSERESLPLSSTNLLIGPTENLFIEKGARIEGCTLNTTSGVIYIGKNAEIMEGSLIRGGLALCESATLKMGAKIYGATTIGPFCKVGGELNNVVFFGNSIFTSQIRARTSIMSSCFQLGNFNNSVSKLVGEQVQKQFDFFEQASAASGIDYKFTTRIEMLDGGNGATAPGILETWELYGSYVQSVNYNSLAYATSDPATITLSVKYDNAIQTPQGTGIGSAVTRTLGTLSTGGGV